MQTELAGCVFHGHWAESKKLLAFEEREQSGAVTTVLLSSSFMSIENYS